MIGLLKFAGKWALRGLILLVICVVALVLLKDRIFQSIVHSRLEKSTGMKVSLRHAEVELFSGKMRFEGLRFFNPSEFGGTPFIDLEQLELEMDRSALKQRQIYFHLLHINLTQLNIVEDKQGRLNLQVIKELLEHKNEGAKPGKSSDGKVELPMKFTGVETLKLSLGKVRKTNLNYPDKPVDTDLAVREQVMTNIKTQEDFQNKVLPVLLRGGVAVVYQIWRESEGRRVVSPQP
jgi:hypothetical protein